MSILLCSFTRRMRNHPSRWLCKCTRGQPAFPMYPEISLLPSSLRRTLPCWRTCSLGKSLVQSCGHASLSECSDNVLCTRCSTMISSTWGLQRTSWAPYKLCPCSGSRQGLPNHMITVRTGVGLSAGAHDSMIHSWAWSHLDAKHAVRTVSTHARHA